ncbi:MAG: hypothetical protein LBR52_06040 [Prevotellaceae bacterium]|jgi:hypothetical protein|nr:hypothetical protein [Prevotellaceae bacterium]
MNNKKTWLIIALWWGCLASLTAQVTSTSQQLDGLNFKKGLKVGGGLSFANTFYKGNSEFIHRDPYAFYLNGNLDINLWGISAPFSFSYSNTNKSYTQPFNRFKLAPSYKWVRLHLGSSSMNFSKYTLAGHQFDGAGVELTPGKWYIGAMYGRLLKAIEYDPAASNLHSISYRRTGYAAKVGYSDKGDAYEASFFTGKDHPGSLQYSFPDEVYLHPKQNTAISMNVKKSFLKYFYAQAEYAFSVYNSEIRNRDGEKVKTSNLLGRMLGEQTSDKFVDAINASLGYQNQVWGLAFRYERVAPNYETLGGYYFTNDLENFTLAPNVRLFKGKISLAGNIGLEYNNLNDKLANNTQRIVGSGSINYTSGKAWNAGFNYSNFSSYTRINPNNYPFYTDELDSLNFYQVSQSFDANVSYTFGKEAIVNMLSVNGSFQNGNSQANDRRTSFNEYLSGTLSFSEQIQPWASGWSAYISANACNADNFDSFFWGPGISVNKIFRKSLSANLSCSYNENTTDGVRSGSLLNTSLSMSYQVKAINEKFGRHGFSLSVNYTNHFGDTQSQSNRNRSKYEFLTSLTYRVSF